MAIICTVLLVPGEGIVLAQPKTETAPAATAPAATATAAPDTTAAKPIPPEQLESLVAPIALYPDDLLAQTLVASTYPLELVQLQQFLAKHPNLKDQALADSVAMQPWDPSIQSMAAVPEVVKRLADDIQWTTDLGNAFLAQQSDVMDAVQRMRKKAKDNGALESNEQQKVETKTVEEKTVIIVQPTNPEVIYVPSYSPTVVYGAPMYYPYPPIYYPYYPPGAAFVSFGIGMMWGAAMWGGSCCGCGWGGNNVNINVNNNFNNINGGNRPGGGGNRPGGGGNRPGGGPSASTRPAGGGGGNWQHNPEHRGGTPYGDRGTANKYGGSARGDSRPSASQQPARGGAGNRGGAGAGASTRPAGGAGAGASTRPAGGAGSAGISDRSAGGAGSRSGSDNIGSRNIPKSNSSSRSNSGLSGGSRGYSGSSARSSSSRGSSSMGSRGGGGRSGGGGGGRGGGGRR